MTDAPGADDADVRVWSPPWPAVGLGLVAAVGLGAWALGAADPPGRLLVGVAAVAVLAATALGALARPRLAADPEGLTLRGPGGRRAWPWSRVDAVRVVRLRRLGMPGAYVEVDARDDDGRERLLVLGRLELGTDPVDVAAELQDQRARAGRSDRPSDQRERPDRDEDEQDDGDTAGDPEPDGRA